MKANVSPLHLTILVVLLATAASCKKSDAPAVGKSCRLVTVVQTRPGSTYIYNISYNGNGQPSQITTSLNSNIQSTRSITYTPNTVLSVRRDRFGSIQGKDSVTLGANNRINNIKTTFNAAGSLWTNLQMIYNGDGTLLKELTSTSGSSLYTYVYTVINGDIITETDGADITNYTYYTDKPYQQGDLRAISSLLYYGAEGRGRCAHLVSSATGNSINTQVTYEINSDGYISRVLITDGATPVTYAYQYECN